MINSLAFLRLYGVEGAAPLAIGLAWGAAALALVAFLAVTRGRSSHSSRVAMAPDGAAGSHP